MAKEWANKDKYHPPNGVLEPRVQMPRAKASVRTFPVWGERKATEGAAGGATPVRPVRHTSQTGAGLDRQHFGFHARTDAKFGSGGRGVTPIFRRETKCISYVLQDQFTHI
jgi:hypothetical protein